MLHVYDTNNDDNSGHPKPSRKNQLNCHGIFVTNEDLNNSLQTLSSSVGSQKIYLKPLPNENDMLNSRKLNDKKRLPKAEHSALLPFACDVDCSTPSPPPLSARSTHNNNSYLELFPSQPTNTTATLQRNFSYSPTDSKNYTIKHTSNSTHSTVTPVNEEENNRQPSQHQKPHRQRRKQHHHHENLSSFHRHSALRQSLGGINVLTHHVNAINQDSSEPDNEISPKSCDNNVKDIRKCTPRRGDDKSTDYQSSASSSIHTNSSSKSLEDSNHRHHRHNDDVDDYRLKTFRLSNLPPWDHLNYALKPFTSNHHGSETKFKGFRLVPKVIQSEYCLPRVHIHSYNIPFQLDDIIVGVNNHKLSIMSEAVALQYVYNAFKDAEHYTVDVDILRSSLSSRKSFNNESSSTMLKQSLITRQKSDSGYSNSVEVNIPSNPHRPRRRREGGCTNYSSCEITPERSPYKNDKKEQKDRTLSIRNANLTNLSRLSLMDYPDSPNVHLKSRQMSAVDSVFRNHGVIDYDDRINTATFASSLCSNNLADSGFVTIRRPKQPSRLTIMNRDGGDVASDRFSLTSAEFHSSRDYNNNKTRNSPRHISPKVDSTDDQHLGNNRSNSRTLTPHTTGVTSPCIPRRSLNMSTKDPNAFNTRTIGQTMHIQLTKMSSTGLGFTLTSRDTQTQSSQMSDPVYVKKILPDGAAIQDGRLLAGDRLLAIDGEEVRSLNQVLSQLRSLTPGKQVDLLISRQISSDLDSNTRKSSHKHLPPRPFMTCTFEYQLPLDTTTNNQSDTIKGPPLLGINFKWSNDILLSLLSSSSPSSPQSVTGPTSPSQYSPIPGLYIDSLVPDTLVTSNNRVTVKTGDRLVAINDESVDGMNAKTIVNKLKNVIKQCHERNISSSGQSPASFTLTVHRYKNQSDRRSSVGDTLKPSSAHPPRHTKTTRDEAVEKGHPGHSKLNSPVDSHDSCSLSFKLSDNRRRLLHRSDSISSDIGSHILHHDYHGDSHSHLSSQRSDIHEDNHLLSTESSLKVNYPTSRNLSVPSNRNFLRDGFGRRSVSEKRHGHVDASHYSFFQTNILPNRYKMPEDVDKQYSTMPTTRRLKMHKARLAAAAAATTNVDSYSSIGGGGLMFNNSTSCTSSGPLKALHPLDNLLPQSLSNSSYRDPEEIDIEPQLDQPPMLRNRKQNTSFRHAVDRSLYPTSTTTTTADTTTTTAYSNSFDTNASPSSSAPPIPPHRPRSESGGRDKLSNNPKHKNSNKTKHSNPLSEKSADSILFSSSPSVYKTIDKVERPHSKSRPEIHSNNNSISVKDLKSSSHSISNNNLPTEQKPNKTGRISLKNLFRIGNSKTESDLSGDYLLHNSDQSKASSETSTVLSKKQLRRLSVPEHQFTNNLITSTKLIDKIQEKNSYSTPPPPPHSSTATTIPSSLSKLLNTTTHCMNSNIICNDSMYKTLSPNIMHNNPTNYKTISVNHPYCPPPDISPPPLPPRVSYSTPYVLTTKSNHSKMIKYHPLPEQQSNNNSTMIDKTKQNKRKKSSYSMTTSVVSSYSTNHQSLSSPRITSTASSPAYGLTFNAVEPTSNKKSNFSHDDNNNSLLANDNSRGRRRRHHHHQQDGILSESSIKPQTPAIYMNSKQIIKDCNKKSTPSPHRSRSTHARLPLNDNITTTTNTVATIMSTMNSPESIHYYQAPLISSHSVLMSTPRRHRHLQDGRKSEYYLNNRKQQVTMQEASLIVPFSMDKLITPKRSIHHQH
ncbi:unnamed protein product [Schistosoma rodhaini]|uniref:Cell polarity protein n=1 Tax=Schistosoma mansoni TaxID=6183 RepID=A0A3Q0KSG4_SCHMA|nr:unnamed protein product [Schistosoma rodhaini]